MLKKTLQLFVLGVLLGACSECFAQGIIPIHPSPCNVTEGQNCCQESTYLECLDKCHEMYGEDMTPEQQRACHEYCRGTCPIAPQPWGFMPMSVTGDTWVTPKSSGLFRRRFISVPTYAVYGTSVAPASQCGCQGATVYYQPAVTQSCCPRRTTFRRGCFRGWRCR